MNTVIVLSIISIHKRAIRIISRSNYDAYTDPIFKELYLLKSKTFTCFN